MRKVIDHPREIYEDMNALTENFPFLAKDNMVKAIMEIGKESWTECPKDTTQLCMSFDIQVISETISKALYGDLQIAFGYTDPKAYWVHEMPPPMSGSRNLGASAFDPANTYKRSKLIMTLLGALGIANERMLASVNIGCRTNYHNPPTKWKFLEDPVNRNIDLFPTLLCDAVDDLIMYHKKGITADEIGPWMQMRGIKEGEAPAIEAGYADWGE